MMVANNGVGRVTSRGGGDGLPRRLRRLNEVWIDHGYPRYFLTMCVLNRQRVLAADLIHQRLSVFLCGSPKRYGWWPTRYVLMPDHLHLLASMSPSSVELGAWIKALKAFLGQRAFRWQAGFFDHVLRHDESAAEKWEYIRQNPVRAGLVARVEDWPFAGEINHEQPSAASGDAAYKQC
jgi:REP element-mobilizing transposase RayT